MRTFPSSVRLAVLALVLLPLRALSDLSDRNGSATPVWKVTSGFSVRTVFDSNVFLQDLTPDRTVARAVAPRQESLISVVSAFAALDYRPVPNFGVTFSFAPEAGVSHSESTESYRVHRAGLNFNGRVGETTWSLQNGATWIDGSNESPTFGCVGGVTAMGGIPLRERRDAFVERNGLRLMRAFGPWFVRPVATAYVHDFLTQQSRRTGYENYVDRQEWTVGADLGREVAPKTSLVAGVRFGRQDQLRLHGVDSPYDSRLRRFLIGLEGTPISGLQCAILTGPETHRFIAATPAGFNRDKVYWWIDALVTLTPGPRDACTIAVRRYALPAFASQSIYEDITYEVVWRHKFGERFSAGAGFKAYGGDWPGPATREDWIFTPSLQVQYTVSRQCSLELAYAFDRAESRIPNTAGREYRRHVTSLSFKYTR